MRTITIPALLLLALAGCDDPTEGTAAAVVGDPAAAEPPEAPPEAADARPALAIDTARSTLGFVGSKVTGSHPGSFGEWEGSIRLDPESVEASAVSITIQMASVSADVERLTNHLKTDDFFDIENHPTATFESTRVAPAPAGAEGGATHVITGRLTMRGRTQTITFPATVTVSDAEVRAEARFTINRQDFGIAYRGMEDDLIRDEVVIHFDVRAPRS